PGSTSLHAAAPHSGSPPTHAPSASQAFSSSVSSQSGSFGAHSRQLSPHCLPAQGSYSPVHSSPSQQRASLQFKLEKSSGMQVLLKRQQSPSWSSAHVSAPPHSRYSDPHPSVARSVAGFRPTG